MYLSYPRNVAVEIAHTETYWATRAAATWAKSQPIDQISDIWKWLAKLVGVTHFTAVYLDKIKTIVETLNKWNLSLVNVTVESHSSRTWGCKKETAYLGTIGGKHWFLVKIEQPQTGPIRIIKNVLKDKKVDEYDATKWDGTDRFNLTELEQGTVTYEWASGRNYMIAKFNLLVSPDPKTHPVIEVSLSIRASKCNCFGYYYTETDEFHIYRQTRKYDVQRIHAFGAFASILHAALARLFAAQS